MVDLASFAPHRDTRLSRFDTLLTREGPSATCSGRSLLVILYLVLPPCVPRRVLLSTTIPFFPVLFVSEHTTCFHSSDIFLVHPLTRFEHWISKARLGKGQKRTTYGYVRSAIRVHLPLGPSPAHKAPLPESTASTRSTPLLQFLASTLCNLTSKALLGCSRD